MISKRVETYPVYVKLNHINMNRGTLNGLIILEPIVKEDRTKSGILIPDVSGKQKYKSGRVVRVHSGMPVSGVTLSGVNIDQSVADLIKNGIPSKLKEGDVVYYREGRGTDIMVDQKAYVLVPEPHLEMIDI